MYHKQKILIVGGGFAGVQAAKQLWKSSHQRCTIQLIDPKSHLEYHGAMYRMVTGRSPMEVCIPFADIFPTHSIDLQRDSIDSIDLRNKTARGSSGSRYTYDKLIIAVGSVPAYFSIPGVEEHSVSLQSACGSARLRNHLEATFRDREPSTLGVNKARYTIVIVGAGATGVELAGELVWFVRNKLSNGTSSIVSSVHLLEAGPRILGAMSESLSSRVASRLQELGVHIHCNAHVQSVEKNCLTMQSEAMQAETIIWTAGVRAHPLLEKTDGLHVDTRGKVLVDSNLHPSQYPDVFVLGDAAHTDKSGMAQTALAHGSFVAKLIHAELYDRKLPQLLEPNLITAIPVGPKWSASCFRGKCFYGRTGWFIRRMLDMTVFLSLLPIRKAIQAFLSASKTETEVESCPL